jgi:hypothetical protein
VRPVNSMKTVRRGGAASSTGWLPGDDRSVRLQQTEELIPRSSNNQTSALPLWLYGRTLTGGWR